MTVPMNILKKLYDFVDEELNINNSYYEIIYFDENHEPDKIQKNIVITVYNYSYTLSKNNRFKILLEEGGGEGGSEDVEFVFQLDDYYFLCHFNYYSYHGYDFDNLTVQLCEPKPVMVTQYHPI